MSLSARRAWIEISKIMILVFGLESLSARRAWIEILHPSITGYLFDVALRKESVDRNNIVSASFRACTTVALRKESVDRNLAWHCIREDVSVALRKESVDRNSFYAQYRHLPEQSLSARRAWIEINTLCSVEKCWAVALRKESVDRNLAVWAVEHAYQLSLSARRAWIEIAMSKGK